MWGTNHIGRPRTVQIRLALRYSWTPAITRIPNAVNAVRIKETINGRPYIIEVVPVGRDRWRAHLANGPGLRTAVMPFYGQTPDEAAGRLSGWLQQVGRTARN